MRFCYFATFEKPANTAQTLSGQELALVRESISGLTGLSKGHLYTPAVAHDIYEEGRQTPFFVLQLYFDEIASLEAAVGPRGALKSLAESDAFARFDSSSVTQQAMLNREFAVPVPGPEAPGACSYLVHYPGPAENLNAWLAHYIEHHPPIMASFPNIRELEILTRVDWIDALPWPRSAHMQRNRIMFDSAEALTAALSSPTRHQMRMDFHAFPPYDGGNFHFPMTTEVVRPRS